MVKSFLKRLGAYLMVAVTLLGSAQAAYASTPSPDAAFSNLLGSVDVARTSPGYYQSQARGVYTAGGVTIRFPRKSVQLISITPPSFSSGCGGISVHFGGLSFISGEEMSQLISNISQAALGYVLQLAIKTLCPQCAAVLEVMQKLAQAANKMGMDACAVGTAIGEAVGSKIFDKDQKDTAAATQTTFCNNRKAESGQTAGYLDSLSTTCTKFSDAITEFDKWLSKDPAQKDAKTAQMAGVFGNSAWIALDSLGYKDDVATKEFMMSALGTVITRLKKKPDGTEGEPDIAVPYPSLLANKNDILEVIMCGNEGRAGGASPGAQRYCKSVEAAKMDMYMCTDTVKCEEMRIVPWGDWATDRNWAFEGYLADVEAKLHDAASAVAAGTPIPKASLALMNAAPFPLYKIVNIAAVYPEIADDLIFGNSQIVAGILALQFFTDYILRISKLKQGSNLPPSMVKEVRDMIASLRVEVGAETTKTLELMTMQEKLMAQVNTINNSIQNNLIPQGVLGNSAFGAGAGLYAK